MKILHYLLIILIHFNVSASYEEINKAITDLINKKENVMVIISTNHLSNRREIRYGTEEGERIIAILEKEEVVRTGEEPKSERVIENDTKINNAIEHINSGLEKILKMEDIGDSIKKSEIASNLYKLQNLIKQSLPYLVERRLKRQHNKNIMKKQINNIIETINSMRIIFLNSSELASEIDELAQNITILKALEKKINVHRYI